MDSLSLLQGIFPTQESNPGLLHCRRILYQLSHKESPFHAKMGTIRDRKDMDITEAEDIKKGGKKTQKNYTKKIFMIQITTMV